MCLPKRSTKRKLPEVVVKGNINQSSLILLTVEIIRCQSPQVILVACLIAVYYGVSAYQIEPDYNVQ